MNWVAFVWKLVRDTVFRKAIMSILWPRIGKPFLELLAKKIFQESYEAVKRAVEYAEFLAANGTIPGEEKYKVAFKQIDDELKAYGLDQLSAWAKNNHIEIAVGEIDEKWEEFG